MYRLAVLVLALLALSTEGRPHAEDVEFDCRGQADGYYADLSDRAAFFSCYEEGLIAKVICEEGFEFDGEDSCVQVQVNAETEGEQDGEIAQYIQYFSGLNLDQNQADEDQADEEQAVENGVSEYGQYRNNTSTPKLVLNFEFTRNIFPKSFIFIERMNREQKNK